MKNLLSNELVRVHLDLAVRQRMVEFEIGLRADLTSQLEMAGSSELFPELGSPLEAVFLVWIESLNHSSYQHRVVRQLWVERGGMRYRADFAIFPPPIDTSFLPLLVEVDGHAFHEKTKEQVEERNRRDRLLQTAGYQVFHFSYSELTQKPAWCIAEVAWAARVAFHGYKAR